MGLGEAEGVGARRADTVCQGAGGGEPTRWLQRGEQVGAWPGVEAGAQSMGQEGGGPRGAPGRYLTSSIEQRAAKEGSDRGMRASDSLGGSVEKGLGEGKVKEWRLQGYRMRKWQWE